MTYRKSKFSTTDKISKSLLKTTSNAGNKAIEGYTKHQSKINEINNVHLNLMEAQLGIDFELAKIELTTRRLHRKFNAQDRYAMTGTADGLITIVSGWITDHAVFVFDLIWSVIKPILLMIVMLILHIVVTLIAIAIGVYLLFLFLSNIFN